MEAVVNLIGNLTFFSVIEIMFVQQDYRTINFLTEKRHNELSDKMMQIASNSYKPISHFVLGKINTERIKCEEPILNVVDLQYLNNETNINLVRNHIFPDDVTIILSSQNYAENVEKWMNLSTKVMILTINLTIFFNTFEGKHTSKINLSPFDPVLTQNFMKKMSSAEYLLRQKSSLSIFFQFFPPKSSIGQSGKDFIWTGPDGSLAETLWKWLKVKPIFCTDIAFTYPTYEKWLDDPVIAPRMHYQFFYPKVLTKNIVKIFNRR